LQDPPKFTQIGIFGLKLCHLATLLTSFKNHVVAGRRKGVYPETEGPKNKVASAQKKVMCPVRQVDLGAGANKACSTQAKSCKMKKILGLSM
jgi:hypothetical protein